VEALSSGRCMVTGYTQSDDGDASDFIGVRDVWMVELGEEDLATSVAALDVGADLTVFPNPTDGRIASKENYLTAPTTRSMICRDAA